MRVLLIIFVLLAICKTLAHEYLLYFCFT
uniref:Uncharacterized protein n=1 Tax=Rhizophora mucronata TaxID=61149 RepID=A0A2P2PZ31_RHIMU